MPGAYFFQIALLDLNNETISTKKIDRSVFEQTIGGKGFASWILKDYDLSTTDPLSAATPLIFAFGPATGLPVWGANRFAAYSKSPLTGFFAESYSGGKAFHYMAACGYDALVITGKASSWSIIYLDEQSFQLLPAAEILGKDSLETEEYLQERFKDRKCAILTIGPAGENLVSYAYVNNDRGRCLGRTGFGALLGSKKIKALVFAGKKSKEPFDQHALQQFFKDFFKKSIQHPVCSLYKEFGTASTLNFTSAFEAFPSRYWQQGTVDHVEKINARALVSRCEVKPAACTNCFISCARQTTVINGKYRGLKIDGPEYETINAFGGICLIDNIEDIIYLNDLCDRLGLDTISAGNCCGLAIEAFRRGKIDFKIDYGQTGQIAELLRLIAYRQKIGDLFAQGVRFAAKELNLPELAVHVKGLELPAYDPRVLEGMGLSYAVSDRGACHLRTTFYKAELSGLIAPDQLEGKVPLLIDFEDRINIFDSLILCRFFRDLILWPELEKMIAFLTGFQYSAADLKNISASIARNIFNFNQQQQMTLADETLPELFFKNPVGRKRAVLKKEKFDYLLKQYYLLRYGIEI